MTHDSGRADVVVEVGNCIKHTANLPRCWLNVNHHFERQQQKEEEKQAKIFISDNKFAKVKNFNEKLSTEVMPTLANTCLVQCSKTTLTAMSVPTMSSEVTAISTAATTDSTDTHLHKSNMIFDIISTISCGYSSKLHLKSSTFLSSVCAAKNDKHDTDSSTHLLASNCRNASEATTLLTSSALALSIQQQEHQQQQRLNMKPKRIAMSNIWDVLVLLSTLLLLLQQTQSGK